MIVVYQMNIGIVALGQTALTLCTPNIVGECKVKNRLVIADPPTTAGIGVRIAARGVVEMIKCICRPVTHLAVQRTVLRIRECAMVNPYVLALVGNQVGTVNIHRTRTNQRQVTDDDVLTGRVDIEDASFVGQRIFTRLLILQLHHRLFGKEGTFVTRYLCAVGQRTRILIRAAQIVQILCLQISDIVSCQIELRAQAGVVDADNRLVLRGNLHHLFDGEITVRTVKDDDVVLCDSLFNLRVVTLSATQGRQRFRGSICEVTAIQGVRRPCLVRTYCPAPGSYIVTSHSGNKCYDTQ